MVAQHLGSGKDLQSLPFGLDVLATVTTTLKVYASSLQSNFRMHAYSATRRRKRKQYISGLCADFFASWKSAQ
jgi:hypothetical protein